MRLPADPLGSARRMVYVVHNVDDPAVHRRVRMLRRGGVDDLVVVGFRRGPEPLRQVEGVPVADLGRNGDGDLGRRAVALVVTALRRSRWGTPLGGGAVVMARSLEALVLAEAFRRRFAPDARLVYESLDVHRAQIGAGPAARLLRQVESRLLRRCQLLVTSSPAYVEEYFSRSGTPLPPVRIQENKVLDTELGAVLVERLRADRQVLRPPDGPPWRIGWFGQMRCARSLDLLAGLCRAFPGHIEVVIRGQPIAELAGRLVATAAATPGMAFRGAYDRSTDLAAIHADVHYCWAFDRYNSGTNSDWCLLTRLYEAGVFGCVPIAQAGVATGDWLAARGIGVLLEEPWDASLRTWANGLTPRSHAADRRAIAEVPLGDFLDTDEDAAALVDLVFGRQERAGSGITPVGSPARGAAPSPGSGRPPSRRSSSSGRRCWRS